MYHHECDFNPSVLWTFRNQIFMKNYFFSKFKSQKFRYLNTNSIKVRDKKFTAKNRYEQLDLFTVIQSQSEQQG